MSGASRRPVLTGALLRVYIRMCQPPVCRYPAWEQKDLKTTTARKRLRDFHRTVQARRRAWEVPGVVVGVVADGEPVFVEGFGTRRVGHNLPVTADTPFAICSCTKAFTTVLLQMLAEEGVLDWDRPVREMLPEFEMFDRVIGERLTTRDLVTHRCGLPRHDYVWYGSSATRAELVHALRHLEPTADLRTTYQYQNLMYMTAGYLAGKLLDSSWEALVQERILDPLGMAATTLSLAGMTSSDAGARPHEMFRSKAREVPYRSLDAVGPAGSINSTVNDMTRWLRLHLGAGRVEGRRFLKAQSLRDIHQPHMSIGNGGDEAEFQLVTYGLGWTELSYRGHRVATHSGGIDGFRCRTSLLLEEGVGTVVLTNSDTELPHVLTWELFDRLLGLKPVNWSRRAKAEVRGEQEKQRQSRRRERRQRTQGTRPSHRLGDYVGTYSHAGYGQITVCQRGDRLRTCLNDLEGRLEHFHYDRFEFHCRRWDTPKPISFLTDVDGCVKQLSVPLQEGAADILFTRDAGAESN